MATPLEANQRSVLVFIGPSGSGKSTIVKELVKRKIVTINPSWTTRPKREGEEELEHVFVSEDEFSRLKKEGFFLDSAKPFSLPYSYGLPKIHFDGEGVPLVMLRSFLIPMLLKYYQNLVIYQIESPYEQAHKRVKKRELNAGTRLEQYDDEIAQGHKLAQRVFVNDEAHIPDLCNEIARAILQDFSRL